ncbi:MAG: hypothetical protein AB1831_07560 [Pseudomonadota bacterium]
MITTPTNTPAGPAPGLRRRAAKLAAACLLANACLFPPGLAHAQVLDRVAVELREAEADIVVHFAGKILYTRHVPLHEGKTLRVFFKELDAAPHAQGYTQETLWTTENGRIPKAAISYQHREDGLVVEFDRSTRYKVRAGADGRSIVITIPAAPLPLAEPSPAKTVPPAPGEGVPAASAPPEALARPGEPAAAPSPQEVESKARREMEEARQALAGKDGATAANRLYRILGLPQNALTEEAQALIGEARELKGEQARARAEYQLYLKLYPQGAHAERVRARLAALDQAGGVPARAPEARKAAKKPGAPAEWKINGSVSSYYYTGKSTIETLVAPPPGELTFNRETLSAVDQDALITSLNFNARRRDDDTDMRVVLRDTDNQNFLDPDRSYNRLYSAYFERTDKAKGYAFRVGRQNPDGGGVLDRFDGVSGAYDLNPRWRAHAVYGKAVEFLSPFDKKFYGGSIELLGQSGVPGISLYAIEQTLDGYGDRRAVGTEVRYFDGKASAYGLIDYDLHYKGVNIALLQGNYLGAGGDNYFFIYDHRRAPSYSLVNAMLGAPGVSLNDLVAVEGIDLVRDQAIALSAVSDMFAVGMTHPLSERWQVGADYRRTSISSTQPVTVVLPLSMLSACVGTIDAINGTCVIDTAAMPGSGVSHVFTVQGIGNNLFAPNAVGVGNLSHILAPTYTGTAVSLVYLRPLGEKWKLDINLRYYTQQSDNGDRQRRLSPSLRLSYQWKSNWYFEGEIGREISDYSTSTLSDHTVRDYIYFGIRWDYQ